MASSVSLEVRWESSGSHKNHPRVMVVFLERGITKMHCKRKEPEKHRDEAITNKKC